MPSEQREQLGISIEDRALRTVYLTNIREHREIEAAWTRLREAGDPAAGDLT
jgi:hypothetical protein